MISINSLKGRRFISLTLEKDERGGKKKKILRTYLVEEPRREDHLEQIINYENVRQLKGLSIFHQLWSQNFDDVYVSETYE